MIYIYCILKAVGRWTNMRAKDVVLLQKGSLFINVATISSRLSVIRGRVYHVDHMENIDMYSSKWLYYTWSGYYS